MWNWCVFLNHLFVPYVVLGRNAISKLKPYMHKQVTRKYRKCQRIKFRSCHFDTLITAPFQLI